MTHDSASAPDDPRMTVLVRTAGGTHVARILPARPLDPAADPGPAAEDATRSAAALLGLPDFVFRPRVDSAGSRTREIGDAVLVVGTRGAVVQVKARDSPSTNEHRERQWLGKRLAKAASQAAGTVRALAATPVTLTNERGHAVEINGPATSWVRVVVLDHPAPPAGYVPDVALAADVVLTRGDWEFLFEQLASASAVLAYLHRVKDDPPRELGTEPVRYFELAAADRDAPPDPVDGALTDLGGTTSSEPLLPLERQAGLRRLHVPYRVVLEDIAASPWDMAAGRQDYLDVLAAVDSAPVAYRAELGQDLLGWLLDRVARPSPPDDTHWRLRALARVGAPLLLFAVTDWVDRGLLQAFGGLVQLRHQQHIEAVGASDDHLTVGVLLSVRRDGLRPWDTSVSAVRGPVDFDDAHRAALEHRWPRGDGRPTSVP